MCIRARLSEKGDFRNMGSDIFFHGLSLGETAEIKLKAGQPLIVSFEAVSEPDEAGNRDLTYTVNGNRRVVTIKDNQALTKSVISGSSIQYANNEDPNEIGANIPGNIIKILVDKGDNVKEGQPIAIIEAMKMETNVISPKKGVIEKIFVKEGDMVKSGQLIALLEE